MDTPCFTYAAYIKLMEALRDNGFIFSKYEGHSYQKSVILRHDVDLSVEKAHHFAEIENENGAVSTYFFLLSTDFYNVASKKNRQMILEILEMGHSVGLHYDEQSKINSNVDISEDIKKEASILSNILGIDVNLVSMHRPSKGLLDQNLIIPGMINSYSSKYFSAMKYTSDSRRNWRENPFETIYSGMFNHLHILTHPFWYNEKEVSLEKSINTFLLEAQRERLLSLENNISNLNEILSK
jgi:hypothetical protein